MKEVLETLWFSYGNNGGGTMGVVACSMPDGSWKAYTGRAGNVDEKADAERIASLGAKLTEEQARGFFPHLAKRRYWGQPDPNFFERVHVLARQHSPFPPERLLVVVQGSAGTDFVGQRHVWSAYADEAENEALAMASLMAIQESADKGWGHALQILKASTN